ncbi:MAG: TIGR00730 family Rossman fold protein [Firmicutes bacterium]|nr:TIGR00730 family Rossman fold protein [Bacillota bacterium]
MNICVFGASSDAISKEYLDKARKFGETIASRGHSLVFGGGATGVMGAAVRGVKSNPNGHALGIAPRYFDTEGILYKECDEFIFTDTMRERISLLIENSGAFAVLPGGVGTYQEFFEVFVLSQVGEIKKPIAVFNVDGCYDELYKLLTVTADRGFMPKHNLELCAFFDNADDMMNYLERG